MKQIFLISLSIITWHATIKSIDPHIVTIRVGKQQISADIETIEKFSSKLSSLIQSRAHPDAPITIPGYPQKKLVRHLPPLITLITAADIILQPNPDTREGSYKELQERILAHVDPRSTLQLMQLGQVVGIDSRITKALSLNIARLPKNTMLGILEKLYKQQEIELRKGIITQYTLANNHKRPETGREEGRIMFRPSDVLIHAEPDSSLTYANPNSQLIPTEPDPQLIPAEQHSQLIPAAPNSYTKRYSPGGA